MLGNFFVDQRIISNVQILRTSFLAHVNKIQGVETDSPDSRGGQGKYTTYATLSWSPFEAALSIFNVSLYC